MSKAATARQPAKPKDDKDSLILVAGALAIGVSLLVGCLIAIAVSGACLAFDVPFYRVVGVSIVTQFFASLAAFRPVSRGVGKAMKKTIEEATRE